MKVSHWIRETYRVTSCQIFSLQRLVMETPTEQLPGDVPLGMRCLKETSSWEAELWRPVSPSLSDPRVSYSEIGRCSVSIFLTSESVLPRLSDSATDGKEHVKASGSEWEGSEEGQQKSVSVALEFWIAIRNKGNHTLKPRFISALDVSLKLGSS